MRIRILIGLVFLCVGRLAAQDSTQASPVRSSAREAMFRDPTTAVIFGALFPGAGHVYSTEYVRGIEIYLGTVSAIGMSQLVYAFEPCTFALFDTSCHPGPQWPYRTASVLMFGAGVGLWVYGAIDARRAAKRANETHRRKAEMRPYVEPRRSNGVNLGMAVSW